MEKNIRSFKLDILMNKKWEKILTKKININ